VYTCIITRCVEIVFIHAVKGSKPLNTPALCLQNIDIVSTEHVQLGVNIQKNRTFDARKRMMSLFPSRTLDHQRECITFMNILWFSSVAWQMISSDSIVEEVVWRKGPSPD
jgi:hypothetical protein